MIQQKQSSHWNFSHLFLILVGGTLAYNLIFIIILIMGGWLGLDAKGAYDSPLTKVLFSFGLHSFFVYLIYRSINKAKFKEALKINSLSIFRIVFLVCMGIFLMLSIRFYRAHFPSEGIGEIFTTIHSDKRALYLYLFLTASLKPILEEILWRGFVFSVFENKFGTWLAMFATSTLFFLSHIPNRGFDISYIFSGLMLALTTTGVRIFFKSTTASMVVHVTYNASLILSYLIV